jgi:hypothetical protein
VRLTTYTVFCPPQTPPTCDVALEFPFVFAEGPGTVQFYGTVISTLYAHHKSPVLAQSGRAWMEVELLTRCAYSINNLGCVLSGTTAATCSGYSSLKSGYSNGPHTGPTEISWTSTMTGTEVQWGVLTLADVASTTDTLEITATAMETEETDVPGGSRTTGRPELPQQTGPSAASRVESNWALVVGVVCAIFVGL